MRLALVALPLALLAACAVPPPDAQPAGPGAFDARAWVAEARALGADTMTAIPGYDDPRIGPMKALADRLDGAVGWRAACNTYWDEETGETVVDTTSDGAFHGARGVFHLRPLGAGEWLAPVLCDYGAYQGFYAVAHVHPDGAALLTTEAFGPSGTISARRTGQFSTIIDVDPAERTFATFALARGLGDCGERSVYQVTGVGTADVVEVRARDCGPSAPDPIPPPEAWPVVFPAR